MKYNLENKTNKFAQRTLKSFSETLFGLLEKESFEKITVNEICEISNYPRATFYNYFEDINDLLNYCWESMYQKVQFTDYKKISPDKRLYVSFDKIYDFMELHEDKFRAIIRKNDDNGTLVYSFKKFLKNKIMTIIKGCNDNTTNNLPEELLAEHYSNILQLIAYWCFSRDEKTIKNQAIDYLKILSNF